MIKEKSSATPFGTVASDRLICNVHQRWFKDRSPESIPLYQVTHAELETRRHPYLGGLLVLVALACGAAGPFGVLIAIVPLAVAIPLLWGAPLVRVHTADGTFRPTSGLPWTHPEAEWFVAEVNHRMVGASQDLLCR